MYKVPNIDKLLKNKQNDLDLKETGKLYLKLAPNKQPLNMNKLPINMKIKKPFKE